MWDQPKREAALRQQGLDFIDAAGIFEDPLITREDRRRADGEARYIAIGEVDGPFFVVDAPGKQQAGGEDVFRVITARRAGRHARHRHQELHPR
ncbi:MAG TPA: BrnT family toxin [Xanthobacteraceae bacterium]